jgi:single-stranded-DNA-specific exonuclease
MIKGSCRSGGDVNIHKLMEHASDILDEYGGHKQAGGFSLVQDNIHLLEDRLNLAFDELVKQGGEDDPIFIDKVLKIEDVDWRLYTHIEKLAPFGIENPKPLFQFIDAEIISTKQFGKEKNHLEITFKNTRGRAVQAIAFFSHADKFSTDLVVGSKINLIAHIEKSTFRNFPELRLRIVDII